MKTIHDDKHTIGFIDEIAINYMTLLVHSLNQVLKSNGLMDESARESICASFLFDFSYNTDAGWLRQNGTRYFPKVCFLERDKPGEYYLGEVSVTHVPTSATSWHEYAVGIVSEYFEGGESVDENIKTGSFEIEN